MDHRKLLSAIVITIVFFLPWYFLLCQPYYSARRKERALERLCYDGKRVGRLKDIWQKVRAALGEKTTQVVLSDDEYAKFNPNAFMKKTVLYAGEQYLSLFHDMDELEDAIKVHLMEEDDADFELVGKVWKHINREQYQELRDMIDNAIKSELKFELRLTWHRETDDPSEERNVCTFDRAWIESVLKEREQNE